MKANSIFRLAGLAMLLLASTSPGCLATALAQARWWQPPERIPYYDDDAEAPRLVADRNRTVHAFNSREIDGTPVILYSQWAPDQGWIAPVDILLLPSPGAYTDLGTFLDSTGTMHLVFWAYSSDEGAVIYYSRALATKAASARAWSPPVLVGEDAESPASVALTGDDEGNLVVVYGGGWNGPGLYSVHSPDAGSTWSQPTTVFLTNSDALWPFGIRMDLDDQGRLHVVWGVVDDDGLGEAVYYAKLETDCLQWSTPVVLAERDAGDYKALWASIIARHGELFVVYQDSFPATRWYRRSTDGGETWTGPVRPFDHVGEYQYAALLTDSSDTLHMILGNRTQDSTTHGMWHSVWQDDRWGPPEAIVSGPTSRVPGAEFDPTAPQAVVSQGNVLLVTWTTDPAAGKNGVWYSYTVLDAPQLPMVALPTPTAKPTPTAMVTPFVPTTTPSSEAAPASPVLNSALPSSPPDPGRAILTSVIPSLLLVSIAVAVKIQRAR